MKVSGNVEQHLAMLLQCQALIQIILVAVLEFIRNEQ